MSIHWVRTLLILVRHPVNPIGFEQEPNMNKDIGLPKGNELKERYWLYMLSNSKPNGPLYLGETLCLYTRMNVHHSGTRRDYAHYHRLDRLVYFEVWNDKDKFIARLRRVRNWPRDMRLLLIESLNLEWADMLPQLAALYNCAGSDHELESEETTLSKVV